MVQEKVRQTGAVHGRENAAVVGAAVVTVAVAVICTRRLTAAAAPSVVEVAAGHSSRGTPAAVAAAVGVEAAARSCHGTPASAVVAVERAVHSYSTTAAVEIATASAAAPAVTRSRGLRNFVVAVVSVAAVVAVVVVVGVRDLNHGNYVSLAI